ncbi:bifunctional adenosylcobinamide kinase/adenosylcobinamide-phosphate guanylyltransferase [Aureimonas sp. Leaf454]|uniref:bifunctional adenosylcobinamide kinase/adenosylcobinamide-phosphate guanylyltransferase n=1 Tax=Aureimonas sp. Leaf454 TaxID=1736381 RepID=UPI0019108E4A|nr:bifunctional adenosylcobinamide kinase/adenosylcobinamide-phosphate guanylyltransferase [Aureimonas sp. Leaf454]
MLRNGATLVLGGARSGKSRFAEGLIEASPLDPLYIATAGAPGEDSEMAARIAEHRARRGERWRDTQAPLDLCGALERHAQLGTAVLVDCLTLWLTNLMVEGRDVLAESEALVETLFQDRFSPVVLVSNEVGLGIVPDNAMARAFRDHAGRLHQSIAARAGDVYFVAAGLPLKLKG